MTIPGQMELPGMPEPLKPLPVEELWVDVDVEIRLSVRVDVAGLVERNRSRVTGRINEDGQPLDYDALDDETLRSLGYGPEDKGDVFVWNQIVDHLEYDLYAYNDNGRRVMFTTHDDVEIDVRPRWSAEKQAELETAIRPRYDPSSDSSVDGT